MIKCFKNKISEDAYAGMFGKRFPHALAKRAKMRLDRIAAATCLDDLRVPPSHQLELLHGDRAGQHSIRINQQWQVCFIWQDGHAYQVEIVDYH